MKKLVGPIILIFMAVISRVIYAIIGTSILEDGTLVEPFYLIGIGSILAVVAGIWIIMLVVLGLIKTNGNCMDEVK